MTDISELDQEAQLLRVKWSKAQNYYNSFVRDFFRMKDTFDGKRYDPTAPSPSQSRHEAWTFAGWLLFKCGLLEGQVLRRVKLFAHALAADEQERIKAEQKLKAQANRAEREAKSQAYQAKQAERKAEKAAQHKPNVKRTRSQVKAKAKTATAGVQPAKHDANGKADLSALTDQVRAAQQGCEMALQLETAETRRERVIAYGQALRALRKVMPSNEVFGKHLAANGLNYRSPVFRSDAMWLAENYAFLMNSLRTCTYVNPIDIRNWWRGQQDKQASKPNGKGDHVTTS